MSYYLVVDNGGTNIKVVLFDTKGQQIVSNSFPTPRVDFLPNQREVEMDGMWQLIATAIRELIIENAINPMTIKGLATVGHGKGVYVLGEHGSYLRNGILSTDNRAYQEADYFKGKATDLPLQPILATNAPVLLFWLKRNEPEIYKKIKYFFSAKDFVRYKLTGSYHTDYTDASSNNLLDIYKKDYDAQIFDFFEINELYEKRSPLVKSTDICGYVSAEAAALTGLAEGTPVIGGMFDIDASAIATNALSPKYISVTAGTWSINEYLAKEPVETEDFIMNSIFVDKEHYLIESSSATSAGNLDIIANLIFDNKVDIYEQIARLIEDTSPEKNDLIFLPFLYGSHSHSLAKGSFIGLDSSVERKDILRAVYEGVAFSHRFHLEKLLAKKNTETEGIRLAGGIVNSQQWIQILADVIQLPIEIVEANELGGLGGAISIAVGLGEFDTLQSAADEMSQIKERVLPNKSLKSVYDKKYDKYIKALNNLEDIW
ncbi:carbohydrate kinase [Suicoccus acidiformans]|uniref:Carbohydrate kinase n=1 Tax=Suicoccus acidiformans TaxID=2036206 RepID=A0A347WIP6_9LACT|nr:FGGY-family carbohydrate kinase [Suicoccus acidiformans]AXY24953.1 carbohydrate kinase [Suicoccus acidiformans]